MWRESCGRRVVAGVLMAALAVQLSGCTRWVAYQEPPGRVLTKKSPERVRVTLTDGTRVEVFRPQILNDTLAGYASRASPPESADTADIRIAVADIGRIEVRQANLGGIVVLVAAGILLVVGVIVLTGDDLYSL